MNFQNHKTILKTTLIYAFIILIATLTSVFIITYKLLFPPNIADQTQNPQLQNVDQAIELITGQTIK
jgi:hypothetical protein